MTPLVTFKGWEGKWWKNIKPGRAALDAAVTVLPGSGLVTGIAKNVGARVGSKLIRAGAKKVGRFFRGAGKPKVRPGAGIGSKVTSGKLQLGNKQAFTAGGTSFNIRNAGKVGSVAAVGVGTAIGIGKAVKPSAAVSVAARGSATPHVGPGTSTGGLPNYGGTKEGISQGYVKPRTQTQPSPRRTPAKRATSKGSRCGCPAGKKHVCFKTSYVRKPSKASASRAAASHLPHFKGKTRKTGAPSAKQIAARKRFAAASRKGPIRKGARL